MRIVISGLQVPSEKEATKGIQIEQLAECWWSIVAVTIVGIVARIVIVNVQEKHIVIITFVQLIERQHRNECHQQQQ